MEQVLTHVKVWRCLMRVPCFAMTKPQTLSPNGTIRYPMEINNSGLLRASPSIYTVRDPMPT